MSNFAIQNSEIGSDWRSRVDLPGTWRKAPNQAGGLGIVTPGEAGGFFVECDYVKGRRAYLKPLKRHGWKRAAREKIAADLAFDLDVNVPPVLLAKNDRSDSRESFVSISLVMYPHQFSWGQIKRFIADTEDEITSAVASRVASAASRAFAFDTWLQQTDHNDHPSNIVFGYESDDYESGRFVFLDYAFSMGVGGRWEDKRHEVCDAAGFPPKMKSEIDSSVLESSVSAIESISDAVLDEVVGRISEDYLPKDEKLIIISGLKARRHLVRQAFGDYL